MEDDDLLECGYSREYLKQVAKDGWFDYIDLQLMACNIGPDGTTMLDDYINSLYQKEEE